MKYEMNVASSENTCYKDLCNNSPLRASERASAVKWCHLQKFERLEWSWNSYWLWIKNDRGAYAHKESWNTSTSSWDTLLQWLCLRRKRDRLNQKNFKRSKGDNGKGSWFEKIRLASQTNKIWKSWIVSYQLYVVNDSFMKACKKETFPERIHVTFLTGRM